MELQLIIFLLSFLHGVYGQVTVPPSTVVAGGDDVLLVCRATEDNPTFIWSDVTAGRSLYTGPTRATALPKYDNVWLQGGTDPQTSTLNISAIEVEDDGEYRCTTNSQTIDTLVTVVTVEVKSARNLSVESTIESNIDMYEATCEALNGRPEITITWMLGDGPSPCGDPPPIIIAAGPGLFSKGSVCPFQATRENYNQTLKCVISGHQIQDLNGEVTATLDMHNAPSADIMMVEIQFLDPSYRVSCNISEANQPNPRIRNYYIYSNTTLIHQSSTGGNFMDVPESEYDRFIVFNCEAGNYLGNTTTFPPVSTTTLTPTTTAETITPEGNTPTTPGVSATQTPTPETGVTSTTTTTTKETSPGTTNIGPIIGGVVGAIVVIVIIVIAVCYCKKEERFCFEAGGTKSSGSSKPAGSAVGSSNGSEREKTKPEAAPRGHGSIQHTNDNPNQDMYAMVDKKPSGGRGGDAPDRGSGPGQNEPQGMLYADLDLSHKAGHTDKHVPKNENDVVVYSSILV